MDAHRRSRSAHHGGCLCHDAVFYKSTIAFSDKRRLCALDHRHHCVGSLYPRGGKTGDGSPPNESPRRGQPRWQAHRYHDTWTYACSVSWLWAYGRRHTPCGGVSQNGGETGVLRIDHLRCDTLNGKRRQLSMGETRDSNVSTCHAINVAQTEVDHDGLHPTLRARSDERQPSLEMHARQDRTAASQSRDSAPSTRPVSGYSRRQMTFRDR